MKRSLLREWLVAEIDFENRHLSKSAALVDAIEDHRENYYANDHEDDTPSCAHRFGLGTLDTILTSIGWSAGVEIG